MKLTKMHGLGNDFILFADPQGTSKDYTDLAIRLCDRRTGIGADGLAILVPVSYTHLDVYKRQRLYRTSN